MVSDATVSPSRLSPMRYPQSAVPSGCPQSVFPSQLSPSELSAELNEHPSSPHLHQQLKLVPYDEQVLQSSTFVSQFFP